MGGGEGGVIMEEKMSDSLSKREVMIIESNGLSNSQLKNYAEEHIHYEYDMLCWSARVLAFLSPIANQGIIDWVIFNGLLNTFAIHARNLTLFFYSGKMGNRKSTDVVIENYVDSVNLAKSLPSIPELLSKVITKANKQVAHLTTNRFQYEEFGKEWNFVKITLEIKSLFVKTAPYIPDEKISVRFKKNIMDDKLESPFIKPTIIFNSEKFPIGLDIRIVSEITENK